MEALGQSAGLGDPKLRPAIDNRVSNRLLISAKFQRLTYQLFKFNMDLVAVILRSRKPFPGHINLMSAGLRL